MTCGARFGRWAKTLPDVRTLHTAVETVLPGVRGVPNPFGSSGAVDTLGFMLPVNDTHCRIFTVARAKDNSFIERLSQMCGNVQAKLAEDPHYFQRFPGDWEVQGSQGPITLHFEEHLASSDRVIVLLRRLFKQQLAALAAGLHPINVAFEPGTELVELEVGQFKYFSGVAVHSADDRSFEMQIASSGQVIRIAAAQTVTEALAGLGILIPVSCQQGVCGTCLTRALSGGVDHHHLYLSPEQQAANHQILPRCSRAKSGRLVLDL